MTTGTARAADVTAPPRGTTRTVAVAVAALVLGLAAFALLFHAEAAAALHVWETSTAYGHCFFVLPIALYLAWDRRDAIRGTPVVPLPLAGLLALPLAAAWFAAERVGLMEGRQLVALAMVLVLFLAILGWRMAWAMAVPLLYLVFLVPFGAFVTPWLQQFTARFIVGGLGVLDIPYLADNYIIEIPEGVFYVAEACAGLRFLIAAVAFGVLYACLIYRGPARRAVFVLVSILVPIVANGFRGLGIVVLGHVLGSAEAAATDHLVYGWVFFSIVILLLVAAGLPFRQDGTPYRPILGPALPAPSPARIPRIVAAAVIAILLTAIGPASADLLNRAASGQAVVVDPRFAPAPGCIELPSPPPARADGVTSIAHRFGCGENLLTVTTTTLPPRANPGAVLAAMRRRSGELDAEDETTGVLHVPGLTPGAWPMVQTSHPARLTAMVLWADGAPVQGGMAFRLAQAWRSVVGATHAPVLVAVSLDPTEEHPQAARVQAMRHAIATFLAAQTDLSAQIVALSAVHGGAIPRGADGGT